MNSPRIVFSLLVLALSPTLVCAQNNPPAPLSQTAPTTPSESAERQIRKTVAFITLLCVKVDPVRGPQLIRAQGTGFFIEIPDSRLPANGKFSYIVTNRHVAMCWDDDNNPMPVQDVSIRVNLKNGSSQELTNHGNLAWILPTDDSVDLAAFPLGLDPNVYDIRTVPDSVFVTDDMVKKESISEGLKIFFSGFFYQVPGLQHVEPILREGAIAMMPEEKLMTTTGKMGKTYLGEVHAFHGNSGSPVFVDIRSRGNIGYDYRLLGIVSGGYAEGGQNKLVLETPLESKPGNSGIAVTVPASALKALLNEPQAVALRDAVIAREAKVAKKAN